MRRKRKSSRTPACSYGGKTALNLLPLEQIVAKHISEAQAVKYLLRLDKIGFLELLLNNRVKLLVARTFAWIPNGPIHT